MRPAIRSLRCVRMLLVAAICLIGSPLALATPPITEDMPPHIRELIERGHQVTNSHGGGGWHAVVREAREAALRRGEDPGLAGVVSGTMNVPILVFGFANVPAPAETASRLQQMLFDGPWPPGCSCTVNADCPMGEICMMNGRCTVSCTVDGDCPEGETCLMTGKCSDGFACTGTVQEYFQEVSYGNLTIDGTVFDAGTMPQNDTFYEGNQHGGSPCCPGTTLGPSDGCPRTNAGCLCQAANDCPMGQACNVMTGLCSGLCQAANDCPMGQTCNVQQPVPCATAQECMDLGGTTCTGSFCDDLITSLCSGGAPCSGAQNPTTPCCACTGVGGNLDLLMQQAVANVNGTVDFGQFDNDGPDGMPNSGDDDCVVDFIAFVHPEAGAETGGAAADNIWSHAGSYVWYTGGSVLGTGDTCNSPSPGAATIRISSFNVQPAKAGNGEPIEIGVYCHEFGHSLTLPDLYDTGVDPVRAGIGLLDVMAGGCYNKSNQPAHLSAWSKSQLGWIIPTTVVTDLGDAVIPQSETTPFALRVDLVGTTEYFLLENRQPVGFDVHLKGDGLIIYHVDETQPNNQYENCGTNVQRAGKFLKTAVVQADGDCHLEAGTNSGDAGDPFPGSQNNTTFNATSTPSSKTNSGQDLGVAVTDISASGSVMTADISPGTAIMSNPNVNIDAVFLFDVSGSKSDDLATIVPQISTAMSTLVSHVGSARFGLATFIEFPFGPFSCCDDYAYRIDQMLTSDQMTVANAVAALTAGGGGDLPESQYEALYQLLTGAGRDLDGDMTPGNSTGEIAPMPMNWDADRVPIIYLLTDASFHNSDDETYPLPGAEAAGRNDVINELMNPSVLHATPVIFVLDARPQGPEFRPTEDGAGPMFPPTVFDMEVQELADVTGGRVIAVGANSAGLIEAVDATIGVVLNTCLDAAGCADSDQNGVRDDNCVWQTCENSACAGVDIIFADMGGAFGACAPDGFTNIHDRTHALTCFDGTNPCDSINIDAGGAFGACPPDGFCNIFDATHTLAAFGGVNPCTCPPGAQPQAAPHVAGKAELIAQAAPQKVRPGQTAEVRVLLIPEPAGLEALQGYQLHLNVSGGKRGRLELVDIRIEDATNPAFDESLSRYEAFNPVTGQMLCGLDGAGVPIAEAVYLATFTYRASENAQGSFVVDIRHNEADGDQTFLVADFNDQIAVEATQPAVITVARGKQTSNRPRNLSRIPLTLE